MSFSGHRETRSIKPGKTTAFFICLCVAAFLWFVKAINTNYTLSVKVPVEFINIPAGKRSLKELPRQLDVQVKSSGLKLFLIKFNQPFAKLTIDMNNLRVSGRNYILSASQLPFKRTLKFETQVKHISPDTLYFTDKFGNQKNVPVKVNHSLTFSPGFAASKLLADPSFVTLTGDSSILNRVDTLYTQELHETMLRSDLVKELGIIVTHKDLLLSRNTVLVKVKVDRLLEKEIGVPVVVAGVHDQNTEYRLYPARTRIKFSYLQDEFSMSDTILFRATVDVSGTRSNRATVQLSTKPGQVSILYIRPAEIEIIPIKK